MGERVIGSIGQRNQEHGIDLWKFKPNDGREFINTVVSNSWFWKPQLGVWAITLEHVALLRKCFSHLPVTVHLVYCSFSQ